MSSEKDIILTSALNTVSTEILGLEVLKTALLGELGEKLIEAATMILNTGGRFIVTGMGKSGHIANKITATLASTGTPAFFVHPAEASHGDLGMIKSNDIILAMSWSGETPELATVITFAKRFKIPLVGMTSRVDSTLAKASDIALTLPISKEACPHGLAPTTSSTMMLAFGDALAIALLEKKGFTAQDFKIFHPGGKLGAQLKTVQEVMHKAEALPLIDEKATMPDGLLIMTEKSFGCLGVVDESQKLIGIITDGDLRRNMTKDLLNQPLSAIMNHQPKTINSTMMLAEVLEYLNDNAITSVFITDEDDKVIGLIHIHDLLRLGVS